MANSPSSFIQLQRSFSMASLDEASEIREYMQSDLKEPPDKSKHVYFENVTKYTFVLPSFENCLPEYRQFLCSQILDEEMLKELEVRCLNWCGSLLPLVPIQTLGDGNCLMHATSLSLVGVNDRHHVLRRSVHKVLVEDNQGNFRIRWQGEQEATSSREGIRYEEKDWDQQWAKIIQLVSEEAFSNGANGLPYGGSEELHIFAIANILRRTVIVVCDDILRGWYGESLSTVPFAGIYLPLNWDPIDCVKTPLVLGYSQYHFTALVPIKEGNLNIPGRTVGTHMNPYAIHAVPLVKYNGQPLKVHFLRGNYERQNKDGLLQQYLDCHKVPRYSGSTEEILVARCKFEVMPEHVGPMVGSFFNLLLNKFHSQNQEREQLQALHYNSSQPDQCVQCSTAGCNKLATLSSGGKCGECVANFLREAQTTGELNPPYNPHYSPAPVHSAAQNISQPMDTMPAPNSSSQTTTVQSSPIFNPHTRQQNKCPFGCKYYVFKQSDQSCQRCKEAEMEKSTPIPCANSGCHFSGSKEHCNLCSRCFIDFTNSLATIPPTAPPQNLCCQQQCHNEGCPELMGRCPDCYVEAVNKFIHPGRENKTHAISLCSMEGCLNAQTSEFGDFCLPCHEKLKRRSLPGVDVNQMNASAVTTSQSKPPLRLQMPPPSMTNMATASPVSAAPLCSTPNCQNLVGQGLGTLCSECYPIRRNQERNVNYTSPLTAPGGNGESTVVECNIKGCTQAGNKLYRNLCFKHYTDITNPLPNPEPPQMIQEVKQCASESCTFFAGPATGYLCSRHFSKAQEEPFHAYPPLNQTPIEVSCAIEGCYNPAREELNNLCKHCYENGVKMELEHRQAPESQVEPGPDPQSTQQSANTTGQQARSRTPSPRVLVPCKTSGCPSLVDPSVQQSEVCVKCTCGVVIKRGNRPSDPVYRPDHHQVEVNIPPARPACQHYPQNGNALCRVCLNAPPDSASNQPQERPVCVVKSCQNKGETRCFNYCITCFQSLHPERAQNVISQQLNNMALQRKL